MKHTISILVENHAGVLARVAGLFARRGFNIDSLAVGITEDEKISRITIIADGTAYTLEQIEKQLKEEYEPVFGKDLLYKQRLNKFDSFCQENADLSLEEALAQYRALSGSKLLKK